MKKQKKEKNSHAEQIQRLKESLTSSERDRDTKVKELKGIGKEFKNIKEALDRESSIAGDSRKKIKSLEQELQITKEILSIKEKELQAKDKLIHHQTKQINDKDEALAKQKIWSASSWLVILCIILSAAYWIITTPRYHQLLFSQ